MLAQNALTTLETVKDELDISALDGKEDNYLIRLINAASDTIERHCSRKFSCADVIEKVPGLGRQRLILSRTPIVAISQIISSGAVIEAVSYEVEDAEAGFVRTLAGRWPWTGLGRHGLEVEPMTGTERPNIEVHYSGGYVTPAQASLNNPRTLPYDLEDICIVAVVTWHAQKGRRRDITSEQVEQMRVSYSDRSGNALPDVVLQRLVPWRRVV